MNMEPPYVKGWPILGHFLKRLNDPLNFYLNLSLQHGPLVRVNVGGWSVYCVSDPDGLKHVMLDHVKNYTKGKAFARLDDIFGKGLLSSDGEAWRKQRRIAQPAFHAQNLAKMYEEMLFLTQRMIQSWQDFPENTEITISKEMAKLTLAIATKTLLGLDVSAESEKVGEALTIVLAQGNKHILSVFNFLNRLPTPQNIRGKKALKFLDSVVYRIIKQRRETNEEKMDLLALFMAGVDEDTGQKMTDRELRDEVMTFFLAGHETTANALSWLWYLLGKNPDVCKKIQQEVDSVFNGSAPRFEDLPRLSYTKQVFEETLRLYPPAWTFSRTVVEDDVLCGYKVHKGSLVVVNPYMMHHHPHYWENPEEFNPERFNKENSANRHRYVYIPFGAGPRQCIGNHFALTEALLIISQVCQRYDVSLVPNQNIKPEALLTLRPSPGVRVFLSKRTI